MRPARPPRSANTYKLNGCIRNTTAACGNVATGLLLRPRWPVRFFELSQLTKPYIHTAIRSDSITLWIPRSFQKPCKGVGQDTFIVFHGTTYCSYLEDIFLYKSTSTLHIILTLI